MRMVTACLWLTVLLAVAPLAHAQAADSDIAVVDIDKLLNESKAGKSIAQQVQAKQGQYQKEFSEKEKALVDAQKKLVEDRKTLSAEDFAARRKTFEENLIETRKLFQKRRTDLDRALGEALAQLRKHVIEITAAVAEKDGYDAVLTRDSVVIVEKKLDITDQVLKDLDAKVGNIKLGL